MNEKKRDSEQVAGGTLGKIVGRVKEAVGAATGREDLHREGRLQQTQAEVETDAAARAREAEQKREEAEIAAARAATEAERRELEIESVESVAAEEIGSDSERLQREARRAERNADRVDPKEEAR